MRLCNVWISISKHIEHHPHLLPRLTDIDLQAAHDHAHPAPTKHTEASHFKKNCPLLQQEKSGNRKHEKLCAVGLLAGAKRGSHEKWFVDSGASVHMCCSEKFFTTFQ